MFEAVIFGIIQGLTEFLPISSSGHLILIPKIVQWQDLGLAFSAILHLATAGAILVFFRKDIGKILGGLLQKKDDQRRKSSGRLAGLILLASIPVVVIGLLLETKIEQNLRGSTVVAWALIVGALFLFWAEKHIQAVNKKTEELEQINFKQALIIGISQVLALIPGMSRSGVTITSGLFLGVDRKTAVRFSFLLGLPAILGAGFLELIKLIISGSLAGDEVNILIGFLSAFVVGIFSLKLLLWLANKANFNIFVIYRIVLGIILLLVF